MSDKMFTPKGGWQKGEKIIVNAVTNNGESLTKYSHWMPKSFKIPHSKQKCDLIEEREREKK